MENQLNYCQACLSDDRKLYPIAELGVLTQELRLFEMKSIHGSLCWECRAVILKLTRFRKQVCLAQEYLHGALKIKHQSLSRLALQTQQFYNHTFTYSDPLTTVELAKEEIVVKDEFLELNDSNFDNQLYSDDCKERDSTLNININDSDEKGDSIYVDNLNSNELDKLRIKKVAERYKGRNGDVTDKEFEEKFAKVVFTEEEMLRSREEKKNQPNFKKIPFKCDSCVLGFTRKDTYDLHLRKKHDKKIGPHKCPVCESRFQTEKQAAKHKKKHYVSYKCRLCRYETLEMWSAKAHCRGKHGADTWQSIHCPCCEFVAKTPEELSHHIGKQHALRCNECGGTFKGLSTLRSHKRRIHGVKREFVCDVCSKTFKSKSRLESHVVSHSAALAQKLSYCGTCRVQYKNIYVYRNHLRTSANHAEHAYQCRECNKQFASKVYWKKHYNFYHLRKSQFQCELCNKLFISDWRLKTHRQTQHGVSRSRDHHCNICGKQFFTLSTLKGHQLTHSDQRSFMCAQCGDTFKQRPALYTHCRLVHKV